MDRAGSDLWPRLFHAMRASRETELALRFVSLCALFSGRRHVGQNAESGTER